MPKVTVAVPHTDDPDEIVKRSEPFIEKIVDDFQGEDLELEWEGRTATFNFKSLTFKIKGDLEVDDSQIQVSVDLPFAAMMFKDKVEKAEQKSDSSRGWRRRSQLLIGALPRRPILVSCPVLWTAWQRSTQTPRLPARRQQPTAGDTA